MPKLSGFGPPILHAGKTALAAGFSWFVAADLVGNKIPIFAPLAALLTVQVTVWESVSRGVQRVLGVFVGVLVAYSFARLAGIHSWSIALIVFVALLAGQALRLGQQGAIQVPVSALLVLVLGAATGGYALDRVIDTALGAGVGILVNLVVVPPTHVREAQAQVRQFASGLAGLLRDVANSVAGPAATAGPGTPGANPATPGPAGLASLLQRARLLSQAAAQTSEAVQRTETAIRWNPGGRHDRASVLRLRSAMEVLSLVERPSRGIARTLADMPAGTSVPPDVGRPLGALLASIADELEQWSDRATGTGSAGADGPAPAPESAASDGPPSPGPAPPAPVAGSSSSTAFYHQALLATRRLDLDPQMAAMAATIAVDAHRIDEQLRLGRPAGAPHPFSDRSVLGP